jgi:hypothetical protein
MFFLDMDFKGIRRQPRRKEQWLPANVWVHALHQSV